MALTARKRSVVFPCGVIFLAASQSGDIEETLQLLKSGADPNSSTPDGLTAHHQCCIDGNLEMLQSLVDYGADVNAKDNEGWTPLHAAASCDRSEIVSYLLEHGADLGSVNSDDQTPQDLCDEDNSCLALLQNAARERNIDLDQARHHERELMMKDALEIRDNGMPANANYSLKFGATPLHVASGKGYDDVVEILLAAGLDVNKTDEDGWTPLHAAAHWKQERACELLSEYGANFNVMSKHRQTCLDVADSDLLDKLEKLKEAQAKKPARVPKPVKKVVPSPTGSRSAGVRKSPSTISMTSDDGATSMEENRRSTGPARLGRPRATLVSGESPLSSRRNSPRTSPSQSPRPAIKSASNQSPAEPASSECRCSERMKTLEQQIKKTYEIFAKDRQRVNLLDIELKRVKEENQALIRVIAKLSRT